ncbi:MAG: nucleotidyl transferase AbiEii/AbiGii toxin family protein [Eggerthellaceae bacterium]|nr:nucleotidyl transferase AbiEii/AbiGii toxin family protein [Eggerthellaceae bacterium]
MNRAYPTPAAFDRAVKKAVKASGADLGEGYRQALRDRFLCRVFAYGNEEFILKGGSGLLARIPDARATRDLDFASGKRLSAADALDKMKKIAAIDLGDWCRFELTRHEESMDENGYSRLLKLRFATYIGSEEKDPVLIDLSLDCSTTLPPERIEPANRVHIEGVQVFDYLAYPLPDQLADKLCAIMELQPSGYPSSRMKDLVDVVSYAGHERFSSRQLRNSVVSECAKRGMGVPERFSAPEFWGGRFVAFSKGKLPDKFSDFEAASKVAAAFFAPALSESDDELFWNPDSMTWEESDFHL